MKREDEGEGERWGEEEEEGERERVRERERVDQGKITAALSVRPGNWASDRRVMGMAFQWRSFPTNSCGLVS